MHVHSQEKTLAVVSYEKPIYEDFYNSLKLIFGNDRTLDKTDIAGLEKKDLSEHDVIISIGTDASKILSRTGEISRLILTLIPRDLSNSINMKPCLARRCTTILIEQPVERYFQLFKAIFSDKRTLVIATSSSDIYFSSTLNTLAKKYNVRLKIITVSHDDTVARSLIKKLNKDDVLLALPDPYIYNKNTAKSIILSAYHKNVPIIAYSKTFAKAGALVSLYSSFDDIASMTAKLASNSQPVQTAEFHPEGFSIEFNDSVAKSLNITIDNIEELKRRIK